MKTARFALLPRDGVFCKDGRGWYTSDTGRSHSYAWPPPSTVRGALRAAWGQERIARLGRTLRPAEWEQETESIRLGGLLVLQRPLGQEFAREHRRWPVPADALIRDGHVERLCPRPTTVETLGTWDYEARDALWRPVLAPGKPGPQPAYWTEAALARWLRGEALREEDGTWPPHADLPERRMDLHVTLDPATQTAAEGMLYQAEVQELLGRDGQEWALGVECMVPDEPSRFPGIVGLGGKRRLSLPQEVKGDLFAPPALGLPGSSPGLRLMLATPARFERGWLPDGLERGEHENVPVFKGRLPGVDAPVVLRAALVSRPFELSTWDMVRRAPRATKRLVPAGAVYFFEKVDGSAFTHLDTLWLKPWGQDSEEGWGRVLPGSWNPKEVHT